MSKKHEITTIKDLVDVVTEENVETLKHDVSEFLDWIVVTKLIPGIASPLPRFVWNDDGVKGVKAVHFYDKDGKTVATVPVPPEEQ